MGGAAPRADRCVLAWHDVHVHMRSILSLPVARFAAQGVDRVVVEQDGRLLRFCGASHDRRQACAPLVCFHAPPALEPPALLNWATEVITGRHSPWSRLRLGTLSSINHTVISLHCHVWHRSPLHPLIVSSLMSCTSSCPNVSVSVV